MARHGGSAMNLGDAARGGLRLTAEEVVAVIHEACAQLGTPANATLPASIDGLSVDAAGRVVISPSAERQLVHTAVADLLDALLGTVDEQAEAIPSALHSLPARLRAAAADKPSVVRDLLAILRWHVRDDPRRVLQALVARAASATASASSAPAGSALPANSESALRVEVKPELPAETESELPLRQLTAVQSAQQQDLDLFMTARYQSHPLRTGASAIAPSPVPRAPTARFRRAFWWAAAAMAGILLSGYAGYRYLSWPLRVVQPASPAVTATPASTGPRITNAPNSESSVTPAAARVEPHSLALPVRGGAFSPSFAAQPRTLLFHAGRNTTGHLYRATLDDRGVPSDVRPLLDEPARNFHARLSPDGNWIAFDSDRGGQRGVYVADITGARISRVSGDGFGAVPSWSPDMKSLAFIRAEPGRPRVWNLWIRTLATGALTRVTQYQYGQVWGASWFPDSASYVYSHEQELIIADRSGLQLGRYPSPVPGRMVRTPAVSPDGRRIVFQVFHEGVWMLDIASGTMQGVLDDPSAEEFAWDPSGRRIAYHSRRDGEWRIWMLAL